MTTKMKTEKKKNKMKTKKKKKKKKKKKMKMKKKKMERDPRRNNNNHARSNMNTNNTATKTCALPLTSRQPQTSCEQKHCKQTQCTITRSQGTCCFAHLYVTIGEQKTNKTIAESKRMSAERWNYARIKGLVFLLTVLNKYNRTRNHECIHGLLFCLADVLLRPRVRPSATR